MRWSKVLWRRDLQQADVIVENTYRVPFVDHAYLEPESGVAWVDENGVITIRVSTQVIEHFRGIADVLSLPHNRVRVIGTYVGGGFGGKEDITVESFLALLTYKTRRPVKLTYTREESILCHSKRHPYVMEYKTGVKKRRCAHSPSGQTRFGCRGLCLSQSMGPSLFNGQCSRPLPDSPCQGGRVHGFDQPDLCERKSGVWGTSALFCL